VASLKQSYFIDLSVWRIAKIYPYNCKTIFARMHKVTVAPYEKYYHPKLSQKNWVIFGTFVIY